MYLIFDTVFIVYNEVLKVSSWDMCHMVVQ